VREEVAQMALNNPKPKRPPAVKPKGRPDRPNPPTKTSKGN
jgi:hypothetical protein